MGLLTPERLRTEYLDNPLGIDRTAPRLGWIVASDRQGAVQTAYRIVVASCAAALNRDEGDLWDTGKTMSDETQHIVYAGAALMSEKQVYWKVRVWGAAIDGEDGAEEGTWSPPATWSMGLLGRDLWQGYWIGWKNGITPTREEPKPTVYLRREFAVRSGVRRATVYATALGLYRLFLNGVRVGSDAFAPEWTDYHARVQYQTYDVTPLLAEGGNAAGAIVGHGWYSGYIGMFGYQKYGMDPSFLMQLNIEYEDGSRESVVTDADWTASFGEIVRSDLQMGETVDARLARPGWDRAGFRSAEGWAPADLMYDYGGRVVAQMAPTIKATGELKPRDVRRLDDGRLMIDMGQNFAGWLRASLRAAESGAAVTFRFGEALDGRGDLYTENLRFARQTDTYICRGGGDVETFEPAFTYHGFRYVEMSGDAELVDATGVVAHSALPETGELVTSHPKLNRLVQNILWTQRANFMSVPTDCPQRDERHGWTGDAQIFAGTALYNMDSAAFFAKWLVDMEDGQRTTGAFTDFAPFVFGPKTEYGNDFTYTHTGSSGWADAPIIIAWKLYQFYGDKRVLERHYDAMRRWVAYNRERHPAGIRADVPQYGDWLSVNERPFGQAVEEFGRMVSHYSTTPYDIFSTAYMAYDVRLLARIAGVLGKTADEAAYSALFARIRDAFAAAFVDERGKIKGDTQTAYAMALEMDLLPESLRAAALERLVAKIRAAGDMAATGFHGTKFLLDALSREGHAALAFRLVNREAYPSWLYSVNQGATTIWERWDGWTEETGFQNPGMNSLCHYAFGSVGEWLYRNIGGIDSDPDAPGFRRVIVRPRPEGGLTLASCRFDSLYGEIRTDWKLENGVYTLTVVVPANVSALVCVPVAPDTEPDVVVSAGVERLPRVRNEQAYRVGSGTYRFVSRL